MNPQDNPKAADREYFKDSPLDIAHKLKEGQTETDDLDAIIKAIAPAWRLGGIPNLRDVAELVQPYSHHQTEQARIEENRYIWGKLPAEEPTVIASVAGEDELNAFMKGKMSAFDYIEEELDKRLGELERIRKGEQG